MGFISLGEALDRVLEKLAVERGEKRAGGMTPPGKCARAEGEDYPARLGKLGCDKGAPAHVTLHQRWERHRDTGRPSGQGKIRRTKL